MTGSNLPPGCEVHHIPGNRPEDLAEEAFWQTLDDRFREITKDKPEDWVSQINLLFERDENSEVLASYITLARDIGYATGMADQKQEEDMNNSLLQEQAFESTRCAVCGETLGYDYDRAEVTLKATHYLSEVPHLIIHQSCWNEETMEIA